MIMMRTYVKYVYIYSETAINTDFECIVSLHCVASSNSGQSAAIELI